MGTTEAVISVKKHEQLPTDWSADWRRAGIVFGIGAVILLLAYWNTVRQLVHTWNSPEFSHCYLIVPISLYLIWTGKDRARSLRPNPNYVALLFQLAVGLAWFAGDLGNVRIVQQVALVSNVILLFWAIFGTAVVRAFRFPLGFLFFAVPFGESFIPPLQDFTAISTLKLLTWTGIPVVMEGHLLIIPNGIWEVAEACSGTRYLLSSFVLGLVFAHLVYRSTLRRVLFMILAVVFPIIANAIRAYGIVLLGYLSDNRIAAGIDHLIYGWVFFSFVTLILFWIGFRWRETSPHALELAPISAEPPVRITIKTMASVAVAAIVVGILPAAISQVIALRVPTGSPSGQVAQVRSPWMPLAFADPNWTAESDSADSVVVNSLSDGARKANFYAAFYSILGTGIDLQASGHRLLKEDWKPSSIGNRVVQVDGKETQVIEIVTRPSVAGQRVFWTWYWVNQEFTSSPYSVKALQAKSRLLGNSPASAVIAVSADYHGDPAEARLVLQDLLHHMDLRQHLTSSYR